MADEGISPYTKYPILVIDWEKSNIRGYGKDKNKFILHLREMLFDNLWVIKEEGIVASMCYSSFEDWTRELGIAKYYLDDFNVNYKYNPIHFYGQREGTMNPGDSYITFVYNKDNKTINRTIPYEKPELKL